MSIHLPIADLAVNLWIILLLGGGVGILSGVFGIGGGFLLTPLLMMLGIPPTVAVGTGTSQVLATSVSGALTQWRRRNVDVLMGLVLSGSGLVGSVLGIILLRFLSQRGQDDLVIALCYVVFLGGVGGFMLLETVRSWLITPAPSSVKPRHHHSILRRLPFRVRFRTSGIYISVLVPLTLGLAVGVLTTLMGIGGGFVMVPAMIYILAMPTRVVVGTSMFQIVFVSATAAFLHATVTVTVDMVLALLLVIAGVIGTQVGVRLSAALKGEQLRALLAVMVLAVGVAVFVNLVREPTDLFTLTVIEEENG